MSAPNAIKIKAPCPYVKFPIEKYPSVKAVLKNIEKKRRVIIPTAANIAPAENFGGSLCFS